MFNTSNNADYNNIELFDVFRSIYNKIKSKFSILNNNNNCESEDIIELYSSDAVYHHSKYILKSLSKKSLQPNMQLLVDRINDNKDAIKSDIENNSIEIIEAIINSTIEEVSV